jgi:hypothetical protein
MEGKARRKRLCGGLIACLALGAAIAAAPAGALPLQPYDGHNPFNCELQDAGQGSSVPDPGADPFCVEYDKTTQNITELGLVRFLLQEPARLARAIPKCFYFQRDHWTGWIVQDSEPELYHWDGSYFIDRARGAVGANLQNFRLLGQSFPAPNGMLRAIPPEPRCLARVDTPAEQAAVYANPALDAPRISSAPGLLGYLETWLGGLLGP